MIAVVAVSAFLGVVIGSFLNVVVYRVPNGLSIVSPPSACPRCGAAIRPYDNIPVVSWLVLRGKCRQCKTAISTRYPLVELGTGLAFVAVAFWAFATRFPADVWVARGTDLIVGGLVLVAYLYLAAVSIALALIDLDVHRLPNSIVLPGYAVGGLVLGAASVIGGDYSALLGGAIGLVSLWTAYFLMAFLYPGGMGLGDVKLAGVLGLFLGYLGWGELIIGSFAAFLLGGVFGIGLLISRRANRRSGIPFGPWMLLGAWVGILYGDTIWSGYLSLIGVR